jgi:hypothetical protein
MDLGEMETECARLQGTITGACQWRVGTKHSDVREQD